MLSIFGDKPWFKSLTAWGLVVFVAGQAGIGQACGEAALLSPAACGMLNAAVSDAGAVLTALGLRRASN